MGPTAHAPADGELYMDGPGSPPGQVRGPPAQGGHNAGAIVRGMGSVCCQGRIDAGSPSQEGPDGVNVVFDSAAFTKASSARPCRFGPLGTCSADQLPSGYAR